MQTPSTILREVTLEYLQNDIDCSNPPTPEEIEQQLLEKTQNEFEMANLSTSEKARKLKIPKTLSFMQIANVMSAIYPICRLSCTGDNSDSDYDLLAIYQSEGENAGVYSTSEDYFRGLMYRFNYQLTSNDFKEVMTALRNKVPRKERCVNRDLIAVNNGIFNYKTKTLEPFTPDLVFLTKSKVNYNPAATNITIHNADDNTDWDIESWMNDLSDDPEIVNVLWEILGAIIRPNVRWNKSAWLYSETGNNGKGTLCELMRSLCGAGSYASISIADFSKDFLLEPLTRATAIIVDENDVGTFIDRAANLKAVITNDVIQINRKFKTPIAYQFFGFMVQCLNEFPRIKDKSDSFYRRQLFIPFNKCFTGKERKYIKNDYLHRTEVLEYVMYKVLNMNYYQLSEPEACKRVLQEYKEFNNPVRQFWEELSDAFVWDFLPFTFLYDLYIQWFRKNAPSGSPQGRNTFINDVLNIISQSNEWYCTDKSTPVRVGSRMSKPEPMICMYGLKDWKTPGYTGSDINQASMPMVADRYRGLQRYINGTSNAPVTVDTDEPDDAPEQKE